MEITNKHLFITTIIIGLVTIGLLLSGYPVGGYSYNYGTTVNGGSLAASAYNVDYSGSPRTTLLGVRNNYPYVPVITKSYYPNTSYTTPSSYNYYYSTTGGQSYTSSSYDTYGGYVPVGCEGGTDYSTVTNEPCG